MAQNKNIAKKTVSGVSWNVVSGLLNQFVQLLLSIVLARLLAPEDFGVVAMVLIITAFANMIQDMGFNMAIIQKKDITHDHFNSVFWFNITVGIVLTTLIALSSPLLSNFYDEPIIRLIMPYLALNYIFTALGMTHQTKMRKELKYKYLSIIQLIAVILSSLVAILMAYYHYGYWSLVVQQLFMQGAVTILLWSKSNWRPSKPHAIISNLSELWHFSKFSFGNRSMEYWSKKVDSILVGKFMGAANLGIYNKAYRFLNLPSQTITNQISTVIMASFSAIQDDKEKIKSGYLKMTAINSVVVVPVIVIFTFLSEDFVLALLGKKWESMIPVLRIFAIGSIPVCFFYPGIIFNSLGKVKQLFRLNLITKCITLVFIIIGLFWDMNTVAIGVAMGTLLDYLVAQNYANKLIVTRWSELVKEPIKIIILATFCSALVYLFFEFLIPIGHASIVYFMIRFLLSGLLYLLALVLVKPSNFVTLLKFLEGYFPRIHKIINKIGIK